MSFERWIHVLEVVFLYRIARGGHAGKILGRNARRAGRGDGRRRISRAIGRHEATGARLRTGWSTGSKGTFGSRRELSLVQQLRCARLATKLATKLGPKARRLLSARVVQELRRRRTGRGHAIEGL
jgi:hypothetical protein